jgi:hypothetical protein
MQRKIVIRDRSYRLKFKKKLTAYACTTYRGRKLIRLYYGDGLFEWFEFDIGCLMPLCPQENRLFESAFKSGRKNEKTAI